MGMPEREFWRMTPRAFALKAEGWAKAREAEKRMLAWGVATVLNGCGRLRHPVTVDDLLGGKNTVREATDEEKEHFRRMRERY